MVRFSFALLALLTPTLVRGAEKITYDDHVFPIFQQSCLNCHNPDKTKGGLDLSTYSGAMKGGSGGKIAEPGDTASKLIAVVTHAAEPVMPPEGDKLGSAQIDTLRAWIDGGLLETKDSQAKKPSKPRFDSAMSADPAARPEGPPPLPQEPLLEPVVVGERTSAIHAMAASPWAPLLAVTGQRQVLLFRTDTLELAGILPFPEGDPISLAFTPNGRYLIVGGGIQGKSGFTVTFDVVTAERVLVAGKEFDSILCADLRPDLGEVATGSPSKLVKLWLAADGSQRASIKKHTDWVTRLDYSPDGVLLATGDRNGGVWVWEALSGNEFHTLRAHQAGITAISFRADSNLLASASADGSVRFWEMNNGTEVRKVDAHGPGVMAFAWGPEGRFATAGRDRVAKLWKADFNQERAIEELADIPTAIAMSQDGQKLFIASYDGAVAVHATASGERIGSLDTNPPALATRIAAFPAEVDAIRREIDAQETAVKQTQAAMIAAEAKAKQMTDALAAARKLADDRHKEFQAANAKLAEFQHQTEQARAKVATHEAALQQHQGSFAALENEANPRRQALETATSTHAEATQALAAVEAEADSPEKPAKLAAARASIDAAAQALTQAQAALAEVDSRLATARDALKTQEGALAAARQDPILADASGAALTQAVDATRIEWEKARDAIPTAEKAQTEAAAAFEATKPPHQQALQARDAALGKIPQHQHQQRHWIRASWNAQAIAIDQKAKALADETAAAMDSFSQAAGEIDATLDQISKLRAALEKPAEAPPSAGPEDRAKAEARAAAQSRELAELLEKLDRQRTSLQEIRSAIDARAPEHARMKMEAAALKARYRAASGV